MTEQVSDIVIYRGQRFVLMAYSEGEPFVPAEHGYEPVMASTACYRGYLCEYEVNNGRLLLNRFHVNQQVKMAGSEPQKPPRLNGAEVLVSDTPFIGRWVLNEVNLPVPYTGGLVIARPDAQTASWVDLGFPLIWKYQEVHELVFEAGLLVAQEDMSSRMADRRQRLEAQPRPLVHEQSAGELEAWIAQCFQGDYGSTNQ